jgi:acetyl esterase/lipase
MKINTKQTAASFLFILAMSQFSMGQNRLPSGSTYKDIVIAKVKDKGEDFELRANLYLPVEKQDKPVPLLLFIHGNGGAYNFANGSRSYELTIDLANRGIAVATVDYRPKERLPDNIFDVKAYIRYFRANASKYYIDPKRIGIWGTSRGGNLASIIAATGDSPEHEGNIGGNLEQSSTIQCAVIYYPFVNFFAQTDDRGPGTMAMFSGAKAEDYQAIKKAHLTNDTSSPLWKYVELARMCNAINYVDPKDPPVFIGHGAADNVTLVQNSYDLYNAYVKAGVPAWLQVYSLGPHGIVSPQIEKATQDWILEMLLHEDTKGLF